jgi:hypothetical protein
MRTYEFATLVGDSRTWKFTQGALVTTDGGTMEAMMTKLSAEGWQIVDAKRQTPPYSIWLQREVKKK